MNNIQFFLLRIRIQIIFVRNIQEYIQMLEYLLHSVSKMLPVPSLLLSKSVKIHIFLVRQNVLAIS